MMTPAPEISVQPAPYEGDHPLITEILLNQKPSGKWISGAYLEAALHTESGYLLMLDGNCPFEETLYIHFLDNDLNPLDSNSIFTWYCPGYFKNLEITGPSTCRFNFYNDEDRFEIEIHPHEKWQAPISFPLSIIKRRKSFTKWISVRLIRKGLSIDYP